MSIMEIHSRCPQCGGVAGIHYYPCTEVSTGTTLTTGEALALERFNHDTEIKRLRARLAEFQEQAKSDRLIVEEAYRNEKKAKARLAEAEALLREASWRVEGEDDLSDRIDAFLTRENKRE